MKTLINGCRRTEVFISPKNYKTLKAKSDLNKNWAVQCRFYDPKFVEQYPDGYQYRKKLNRIKCDTIQEQKEFVEKCKEEMEHQLDKRGYNPISDTYYDNTHIERHPDMLFYDALIMGQKTLSGTEDYLYQIKMCVQNLKVLIEHYRYDILPIKDIDISHIKNILEKAEMTPSVYNHSRSYLMAVFKELIQYGCLKHNPCRELARKKEIKTIRETLDDNKFKYVKNYLEEYYPGFHRFFCVFFLSGARIQELLRLKVKDVYLEKQEYKILIKKRSQYEEVIKPILPEAIPYWKELMKEAKSEEDFIFSKGLKPGPGVNFKPILRSQITRRWREHVKNSNKIIDINGNIISVTEDFYSLKHLFLDKLDEAQTSGKIIVNEDLDLAQAAASHERLSTTVIYTTKKEKRKTDALKKVKLNIKM